jgi:hypothetical protein
MERVKTDVERQRIEVDQIDAGEDLPAPIENG